MSHATDHPTTHSPAPAPSRFGTAARFAPGISVAAIWVATLCLSVLAPDMVSGSQQEHLPIAAITAWLWAAAATGYVLMAARGRDDTDDPARWVNLELSVVVIWAVVALAAVLTPELVTGTDPTRIPLAAIIAPVAGMVATGFAALHATTARR